MSSRRNAHYILSCTLLVLAGCSTTLPEGVISMKIDDRTAHVSLPPETVRIGNSVALIESRCATGPRMMRTRKPQSEKCKKVVVGRGVVIKALNDRYAVAEFPPGLGFDEGDAIRSE